MELERRPISFFIFCFQPRVVFNLNLTFIAVKELVTVASLY